MATKFNFGDLNVPYPAQEIPWYDSYNGILKAIESLRGLRELIFMRRDAGYNKRERLNTWYILGRYMLDGCGNVGIASNFIPAEKIMDFPRVLDSHSFQDAIHEWQKKEHPDVLTQEEISAKDFDWSNNKRPLPISVSFGMRDDLPHYNIHCPYCKKGWEISNVHDVHIRRSEFQPDLDNFIGKCFIDIRTHFQMREDAIYYLRNEKGIRNDAHIDLSPMPGFDSLKVNERGWIDVVDDYVVCEGDETSVNKYEYYHSECLLKHAEEECEEFLQENGDGYESKNLAGVYECDPHIKLELNLAGINIIEAKAERSEVPYNYEGTLGDVYKYHFRRAWSYWVVGGLVPLDIAEKMYDNEEGKKSVRVAGDCGCPPPKDHVEFYDSQGIKLCSKKRLEAESEEMQKICRKAPGIKWVNDPEKEGLPFISSYHISTWQGLQLFANTIKGYIDGIHRDEIVKRIDAITEKK